MQKKEINEIFYFESLELVFQLFFRR
jgi:hypothetical protein